MAIPKSPTTEWPSTDSTLTMLVDASRMPAVTASASMLAGSESVFAHIEVDDMPKDRARHSAHFALIGPRDVVLRVLASLVVSVQTAPVPIAGEDQ
jgi:hypothetical protein